LTGDGLKGIIRNGMENLVKAVEGVLLGMSEELDKERIGREEKEEDNNKRLAEVEKKGEEMEENVQGLNRRLDEVEVSQEVDREVMEDVKKAMIRG